MIRGVVFFTALAVLAATPAYAETATLDALAQEAVHSFCPDLMESETPLAENARISDRGYVAAGEVNHPRFGRMDIVEKSASDGAVAISNSRDASVCQVILIGAGAKSAFERLLAESAKIDPTLVTDPTVSSPNPDVRLVSLRTPSVDGVYLGVQFVDATRLKADGPLVIQQYLLEE